MALGTLTESARQGAIDRSRIEKKVDDTGGTLVQVREKLEVYVETDKAAHDKLASQVGTLALLLTGDAQRNERGLVGRVQDLEAAQQRQKNIGIGAALGAGLGGTGLGATLYAAGKKLGLWIAAIVIVWPA